MPGASVFTKTGPPDEGGPCLKETAQMERSRQRHSHRHLTALHARFLCLLPHVEVHGRIYFRRIRCPHKKADAIQEMLALAWLWFIRLARRGKDPIDFTAAFVTFLARAVNSGRRVAGASMP